MVNPPDSEGLQESKKKDRNISKKFISHFYPFCWCAKKVIKCGEHGLGVRQTSIQMELQSLKQVAWLWSLSLFICRIDIISDTSHGVLRIKLYKVLSREHGAELGHVTCDILLLLFMSTAFSFGCLVSILG